MAPSLPSEKRLKQRAKKLKKQQNLSHARALDLIAKEHGFDDWKTCQRVLSQQEQARIPSPQLSLTFLADDDIDMDKYDLEALDKERVQEHSLETKSRVNKNKKTLINLGAEFSTFEPTITGFKKSILDATQPVRTHFEIEDFHVYETQEQGPEAKVIKEAYLLSDKEKTKTRVSLYRPKTKKGDPRMWFSQLKKIAQPQDIIAITIHEQAAYLFNLSTNDLVKSLEDPKSVLGAYLHEISHSENQVANELLEKLKELAKQPIPSLRTGDTGVGYTLESCLGISANSSKEPDYKGIELKAGRGGKNRSTLFAQVADWSLSPCKRSAEILNKYGYEREDDFKLYCTVSTQRENSQGLSFIYDQDKDQLQEWHQRKELVAVWPGKLLRERLKEKHRETFWIQAKSLIIDGKEHFQLESVTYTKSPVLSQLMPLLQSGVVTMDHLIKRNSKGRVTEKGPLFKMNKRDLDLLFPKPEIFKLIP
jgi:hypothetical protein